MSQKAFYSEGYFQILTGMLGLILVNGIWMLLITRYDKKGVYIDSRVDCLVSEAPALLKSC